MELESMEHEERLVELLGLKLIGPSPNFSYNILNENEEIVGFIQRKRVKREKGNLEAVYGYHMVIENEKISYNETRSFQNEFGKFEYQFKVKDAKGEVDSVLLSLTNRPSIIFKKGKLEDMEFSLNNDQMYFNFKRDTFRFSKEETVVLMRKCIYGYETEYTYNIHFCEKGKSLNDEEDRTAFEIKYHESDCGYISGDNMLEEKRLWQSGRMVQDHDITFISTMEEAIKQHKRGLESFRTFRKIVNEKLPFEQDIFDVMLENYEISEFRLEGFPELALFLPKVTEKVSSFIPKRYVK